MISYHQISLPSASLEEIQIGLHFSDHSIWRKKKSYYTALLTCSLDRVMAFASIQSLRSSKLFDWILLTSAMAADQNQLSSGDSCKVRGGKGNVLVWGVGCKTEKP